MLRRHPSVDTVMRKFWDLTDLQKIAKKSDRSATTSPTFGGSSSGSPLGNFGGSTAGSPTYPRTSVTDRLDAVNAKLALREGDIRAVSRAINITVVHNHPINSSDLRSQRFTLNG